VGYNKTETDDMMKKYTLLTIGFVLFVANTQAQQLPLYSQLYFMRMLYNPALTAYNGSSNLYGFYRDQWTDIPGHPVTAGALGEISLWKNQIGTGFNIYEDNTDIIHRINAQVYYAQKVRLAKDHLLSFGVSLGVAETHIDFSNVVAADVDDEGIAQGNRTGAAFAMNVGLAYQWKKLTVNFAIPQVVNTEARLISQLRESDYTNTRNFLGGASYEFSFQKEKFNVEPSILLKGAPGLPMQIDGEVTANYKRFLFLGVGYRSAYGFSVNGAVRISKMVTIGYAYEYPIIPHLNYAITKGTHELILGINFDKWLKKKNKDDQEAKPEDTDKKIDTLMEKVNRIISVMTSNQLTKQQLDSARQSLDSILAKNMDQDAKIKDLYDRMDKMRSQFKDSLDNMAKAYQQRLKENPPVNFPEAINKDTKANEGEIYRLNSVAFDLNSSYLKKESNPQLDNVIAFLKLNPNIHIRIVGHTDSIASTKYNQWLSERRAMSVYDYLLNKGIYGDRMVYIGFGEKVPIADNATEAGRAVNRRVEFEMVK
jgi:type IX secretion system PorP/SprF family membrane protein